MDELSFNEELLSELGKLSLVPDAEQITRFSDYYVLLQNRGSKINLTAITGQEEVIRKHFADSLTPMAYVEDWDETCAEAYAIDVGSGAGFPGIPLQIMNPGMHMTLLDSQKKRIRFMNEVIMTLSLFDAATLDGRAEDLGQNEVLREKYDLCVSRAVANLSTLSEYCLPFVKVGGRFISYKSADIQEELEAASRAIEMLGGELKEVCEFDTEDGGRSLIVIEKVVPTPSKYPRKVGKPAKDPL